MTQIALFPEDHAVPGALPEAVQVRLKDFELCRPRQWGACLRMRQIALFADDRAAPEGLGEAVQVRLKDFELHRPRQWGSCWLALDLWEQLQLDAFWQGRLPPSRKGTSWLNVLKTLTCYRLIDPGSEWRLHRHRFLHCDHKRRQVCRCYLCLQHQHLDGRQGRQW